MKTVANSTHAYSYTVEDSSVYMDSFNAFSSPAKACLCLIGSPLFSLLTWNSFSIVFFFNLPHKSVAFLSDTLCVWHSLQITKYPYIYSIETRVYYVERGERKLHGTKNKQTERKRKLWINLAFIKCLHRSKWQVHTIRDCLSPENNLKLCEFQGILGNDKFGANKLRIVNGRVDCLHFFCFFIFRRHSIVSGLFQWKNF